MDTELAPATSGAVQDSSEARLHRGRLLWIADDEHAGLRRFVAIG